MEKNKTGFPSIDKTHLKGQSIFKRNPIIPNMSVYNALKLLNLNCGDSIAVDCGNLRVLYKDLFNDAAILARAMKELGIKKGDIVISSTPNYYQAIVVFLAANKIGAITTFLNSFASDEEIKHYIELYHSPLYINFNKDFVYNNEIINNTCVRNTITLTTNDTFDKGFIGKEYVSGYNDCIRYSDIKGVANYYKKPILHLGSGNDESLILYTSGTTGNPKSVILSNENILASGIYMKNTSVSSSTKNQKSLNCVPFTYPYGFATSTLMTLLCGSEAILAADLSPITIDYYLNKKPNIVFGSPALLELIMKNTKSETDLSSITSFISGGDFLSPGKIQEAKDFFCRHNAPFVKICNGSGNAETVGASTISFGNSIKDGTVGKVLTGSSPLIIDDETMEEKKYGEEGQLCIAGKHVFKGYFGDPKLTEESMFKYKGKTYFKTGTRGCLDEENYFSLTGRASRFYITSTLNKVYCDRIQNAITSLYFVESCAVVKEPDDDKLYVPHAFVILKPEYKFFPDVQKKILELCSKPLTLSSGEQFILKEYEIPENIEIVEEFPRSKSDKIDYNALENRILEEKKAKKIVLK